MAPCEEAGLPRPRAPPPLPRPRARCDRVVGISSRAKDSFCNEFMDGTCQERTIDIGRHSARILSGAYIQIQENQAATWASGSGFLWIATASFSPYAASRTNAVDVQSDHAAVARGTARNGEKRRPGNSARCERYHWQRGQERAQLRVESQKKRRMLRPSHDSNGGFASMICSCSFH